jgi:hypothetical protein
MVGTVQSVDRGGLGVDLDLLFGLHAEPGQHADGSGVLGAYQRDDLEPPAGRRRVDRLNLDGDGQGDAGRHKPADGNLLVCCSRPVRDVVIDL